MSDEQPALRVALVGIVVVSMFAALFARLYYLQVLRQTTVEEVFGGPLLREVSYEGTRGRIVDRNGKVLVDNRESIVITIDRRQYEALEDKDGLKLRLARALNDAGFPTKVSDIGDRIEDPRYDPLKPVPIAEDVSPELEAYVLERLAQFPSVDVVRTQVRTYPYGSMAAHVLGYTGAINSDELEARQADPKAYEPGDEIGKAGVERVFEAELRATPGRRTVEVDATEREIGTRGDVASVAGSDLQLTIDADLQKAAETLLQQSLEAARQQKKRRPTDPDLRAPAGAVVVLDAKTSEVLAMASYPSYDPAEFIGGISAYRFNELNDPAAFFPFTNRAIQSLYSPGSTFKPFTAVAALERGATTADEIINDTGSYTLADCTDTCVFQNAGGTRYGKVDLRRALTVSSDVYFYRLGEKLWNEQARFGGADVIQQTARQFGMGSPTGVQLPDEASGLISDPAFKQQRNDENPEAFPYGEWFTGDNVNLAIGQGDVGVTPLQLANAYAALADGGVLHAPSIVRALLDHDTGAVTRQYAPRDLGQVALPPTLRQPIVDGLAGVVESEDGTAYSAFRGFPTQVFPVAGKTGTAEVPPKADTALFASFAPVGDPRYVVVGVMEEAGFSAETAAVMVRHVIEQIPEVRPLVPLAGAPGATTTTTPPPTIDQPDDAPEAEADDAELAAGADASPATTARPAAPPTAPPAVTTSSAPEETTTTVSTTSSEPTGTTVGDQSTVSPAAAGPTPSTSPPSSAASPPSTASSPPSSAAWLMPLVATGVATRRWRRRRGRRRPWDGRPRPRTPTRGTGRCRC